MSTQPEQRRRWPPRSSIRARLLVLVGLAVLPAIILIAVAGLNERKSDTARARTDEVHLVKLLSQRYSSTRDRVRLLLGAVASLDQARTGAACTQSTATVVEQFGTSITIGLTDADGNLICGGGLPAGAAINISDRSFFSRARDTNDFAEGDYQVAQLTGKPTIGYALPIVNRQGERTGFVVAGVDLSSISRELAGAVPAGTVVTMYDRNGTVLAQYPESSGQVGRPEADSPVFLAAKSGKDSLETKGEDGTERLYGLSAVGDGGLVLSAGVDTKAALATANGHLQRNLAFAVLAAALAMLAAWVFGKLMIVDGVKALVSSSRLLAAGDLRARSALSGRKDEIGELAQSFNQMAAALDDRLEAERREKQVLQRTSRDLSRRIEQLNALYGVFSKITERLSVDDVVQATLEEVARLVKPESAVFRLLKDDILNVAGSVTGPDTSLHDLGPVRIGEGIVGRAAALGRTVRLDADAEAKMSPGQTVPGAQSGIVVPVIVRGKVLGTLGCWWTRAAAFTEEDKRVLEMMANQVATAVLAAETTESSELLARRDPLTGLPNRLQLAEDLAREGETPAQPVIVAMADIDHFKGVNDSFGHDMGDLVLQSVANAIRSAVRNEDRVYRYGGEEFLVIFRYSAALDARKLCERVRLAVEAFGSGSYVGPVTVSIGYATIPGQAETMAEAVQLADKALYAAKVAGRNRIASSRGPVRSAA